MHSILSLQKKYEVKSVYNYFSENIQLLEEISLSISANDADNKITGIISR